MEVNSIKRLNWGCGGGGEPGWINSDRREGALIDHCCDIRNGLPVEAESIDYAVSIHALQEIPWIDLLPVLEELRRVLKTNGVLRLCLPDLEKGLQAFLRGDRGYFLIPDQDAQSLGGKFILHVLWLGHSRMLFTADFIEELLRKAGFREVVQCRYHETSSRFAEIIQLDNREAESLFVEATK